MNKKTKFWVRVMAIILCALMVGGGLTSALYMIFAPKAVAAVPAGADYVTVGLMYGSDITVGFETTTSVGYTAGIAYTEYGQRGFIPIYEIDRKKVSVACDASLDKTAYTYSIADANDSDVAIGGFHLEVMQDFENLDDALAMKEIVDENITGTDMYSFVAYINGNFKIRFGNFALRAGVKEHSSMLPEFKEEYPLVAALPSDTCVCVLDPMTDEILFEYDDGVNSYLGLCAVDTDEKAYIKTPAQNIYDGVFVYSRYISGDTNGVQLVNMLPLEDYIAGVMPYEISPTWEHEAQRAFAIAVRTYAVQSINRHKKYGFDVCNSTDCQVYRGVGRANENVYTAVSDTTGKVVSYKGGPAEIYYSSSVGGVTASAKETWGSLLDYSYLCAVETPWEKYADYSNGLWTVSASGGEIADNLRAKGYDEIKGDVVDIEINSLCENSSYVYSVTFTDEYGSRVTVNRADKVRSALSKFIYSANFVVGRGEVEYTYNRVNSVSVLGSVGVSGYLRNESSSAYVITENGIGKSTTRKQSVLTSDGVFKSSLSDAAVITAARNTATPETPVAVDMKNYTEVAKANSANDFVFAGKGWGHGVGLSQYGILDLAKAGAQAEDILKLYLTGVEIVDKSEVNITSGGETADGNE